MSNTTLTNIQILRSAVPFKRPDPGFLLDGQLALNYKDADPGLFAKLQNGALIKIGPATITTNGQAPNATPDTYGHPGNLVSEQWLDARSAFYSPVMKTWDGTQWVANNGFQVDDLTGDFTLLKTLTVGIINADSGTITGQLNIGGSLLPNGTQCVHDLGAPGERWKGLYACSADISGHLAAGDGAEISKGLTVDGNISGDGNLDISGSVTFGQQCLAEKFTVKTPTFLNCNVDILGDTHATNLDLSGDLTVDGDMTLGRGCGVTSLVVHSDTTFKCNVQFNAYPLTFEHIIVTDKLESLGDTVIGTACSDDTLTVTAVSTFNCLTELEGETRVGRVSGEAFRTFGPNVFQQTLDGKSDMTLVGKGYSAATVDSDPFNTLVTKQWTEDHVAIYATQWDRIGQTIVTQDPRISIVPNGVAELGLTSNRWNHTYTNDITITNKATSASTVDADSATTLVTKDFVLQKIQDGAPFNGQINFNAGNGLEQVGTNATANQFADTTKTFSVVAADNTIDVSTSGIKVNTANLPTFDTTDLNTSGTIVLGDGCATSTINLNGATTVSCDMVPATHNTRDLGTDDNRFKAIYAQDVFAGDLHLKNERGSWTLIEEDDCLTMRNNKTGKRYAISMTPYPG